MYSNDTVENLVDFQSNAKIKMEAKGHIVHIIYLWIMNSAFSLLIRVAPINVT